MKTYDDLFKFAKRLGATPRSHETFDGKHTFAFVTWPDRIARGYGEARMFLAGFDYSPEYDLKGCISEFQVLPCTVKGCKCDTGPVEPTQSGLINDDENLNQFLREHDA